MSATEGSGESAPAAAPAAPTFSFGVGAGGFAAFGAAAGAAGGFGAPGAGVAFGAKPAAAAEADDGEEGADDAAEAEAECTATFKPLVQLEEVATTTGEEDEEVLFEAKAKSYRFADEWKEKGTGPLKLLQHKESKKVRLLMRREKTLKICANFLGAARRREQPSRGPVAGVPAAGRAARPRPPLTRRSRGAAPAARSAAGREAVGAQRQRQGRCLYHAGLFRGEQRQAGDVLHPLRQRRQCAPSHVARRRARRGGRGRRRAPRSAARRAPTLGRTRCGRCRGAARAPRRATAPQRARGAPRLRARALAPRAGPAPAPAAPRTCLPRALPACAPR
jgi:hypothetical protein